MKDLLKKNGEKFIKLVETPVNENTLPEIKKEAEKTWNVFIRLKRMKENTMNLNKENHF